MNIRLLPIFALCCAVGLQAQDRASGDPSSPLRSPEELSELLGPIALYPDPLISLILPATTVPSDIVLADRFVAAGGDPDALAGKPWDESVKALTRYPDTLKWLDDNLDWTTQVGDAFTNQPDDVMNAIQALRAKAKAVGNLVDTPEQNVVADDTSIRIVPAQPDYIYVPRYDPEVVYYQPAPPDDFPIYFSTPYIVGPWLGYDFDWYHHRLYRGEWHRGWDYGRDRDRGRGRGRDVFINNSITNTTVWNVNKKRRISTGAAKSVGSSKSFSAAKLAVVKPKVIPKVSGMKPGAQPKPAFVPKLGSSGKTGSPSKIPASKLQGATTGVAKPNMPAPGIKGETIKPKGEIIKPKGETIKPKGEIIKPRGETIKPRGETIKPKGETIKPKGETIKPKGETIKPRGESPKPKVESRKEAPKPAPAKLAPPKPHVEAHKEAPKPAPKPHADTSKDGKKKDKKDQ